MKRHQPAFVTTLMVCLGVFMTAGLPASAASASREDAASPPREGEGGAIAAIERAAHPLRSTKPSGPLDDLRPLGSMVGDAKIAGVGEATHSSHEFFTMKHRVFRYLVAEKGFRTFSLEAPWSTGLRLNDYVLHGKGDPRRIMSEDFQESYLFWNTREYLSLVKWMRAYNRAHPHDPVRFMGNDAAYAGPELYDRVTAYVRQARPELLPEFTRLYRGLRPTTDTYTYMRAYVAKPPAERREMASRTGQALELLRRARPASGGAAHDGYAWALRHATALDQTARLYAFDPKDPGELAKAMVFRDRTMAENTAWWQERTGDKVMLSAHNGHVGYESVYPDRYPKTQGGFLRDRLGPDYVTVGLSFHHGSFNATEADDPLIDEEVRKVTLGAAAPGNNEPTLDRVRYDDYLLDMRTAPAEARDWLGVSRPTREIGTAYPWPDAPVALARSYDVLIHLHEVRAADRLPH
ncbi:erythromycin esterase family protein [Streptomyces sp. P1-3]|uniref:erythromycin esterase family protein n=1 Tax=Streptomyces sp. P1-3 TaxID=3421658 RepID=UPI003D369A9F